MTDPRFRSPTRPLAVLALAATLVLPGVAYAQTGQDAPTGQTRFDAEEEAAIGTIVRDYLIANPEVLIEAMSALEAKRAAQQESARSEAIAGMREELVATPEGTALGNPDGDVTITEFFDYNCPYCRQAQADIERLVDSDEGLRVVYKEMPALGRESYEAARVSLAVRAIAPAAYTEFHADLIQRETTANEETAIAVAGEHGVDEAALREAMNSQTVAAAMQEAGMMADALQITGTPSFVIGGTMISGAVGEERLRTAVANMRECGQASC